MFRIEDDKYVEEIKKKELIQSKKALIPYYFAKKHLLIPIEENDEEITIALCEKISTEPLKELSLFFKKKLHFVFCSKQELEEAIEYCYRKENHQKNFLKKEGDKKTNAIEDYDLLDNPSNHASISYLNTILIEAIQQGASDVHFEPADEVMNIRFRIDGILLSRFQPKKEMTDSLLTRLKVMAQLDIAEKRLPQDGRIKLRMGERQIDFRVSTVPTTYGERVVLRLLDRSNLFIGLDRLGLPKDILTVLKEMISYPEGILLVTGPTGSGKTTTLYSLLQYLDANERNIMTIEDPVEYRLSQIAQIAVNPKVNLTFSRGLRHILRQDPDAIMVGEIRDKETAEIAVQSSLTGHLVFTTLHTNDAPSAVTRLVDMGVEPYLLTSSLVGILAQRLVRKLCRECKKKKGTSEEEKRILGSEVTSIQISVGCEKCFQTGFKGRMGIYELMTLSSTLRKSIIENEEAHLIKNKAIQEGMRTLFQQGCALVRSGETTLEEVFRVSRENR